MEGKEGWEWGEGGGGWGVEYPAQQANLDECSIPNPKLGAFMRGSHLVGTEVDCRQQVLWRCCYDGPEAVHLHCAQNC